jgi:sigma-54-specific transcriptional regulator
LDRLVKAWGELLAEGRQDLFDAVEFALVHTAYRLCAQNQVRTARAMGITRNMLRTLLKRHGLLPGGAEDPDHGGDEAEGGAVYHAP